MSSFAAVLGIVVGALTVLASLVGGVVGLLRLGTRLGEVTVVLGEMKGLRDSLKSVPTDIEFLKSATSRNTSDIRALIEKQAHMRGRLDSQSELNGDK